MFLHCHCVWWCCLAHEIMGNKLIVTYYYSYYYYYLVYYIIYYYISVYIVDNLVS